MLASCNSFLSTPTTSQADKLETAIATVSTALAETQRAMPTATSTPLPTNTPIPPTVTPTLTVVPGPTGTPIFPPIESFVGIWRKTRGNTERWPTIVIRASEDGTLLANLREACERPQDWSFPTDCDGGFPSARYTGNPVLMIIDSGKTDYGEATYTITLSLNGDILHVTTFTDYTDNSGIADKTHEDEFHKDVPSFPESEQIVFYHFWDGRGHRVPLVVVRTAVSTPWLDLVTVFSDEPYTSDTAADLRTALEIVFQDEGNRWVGEILEAEIVDVTFRDGHADLVLQGEYSAESDEVLSAASVQILLTVFVNPAVQTAAVTLNGDTIGNLGVSSSTNAKPADYVYTRAEMETYLKEHAYSFEYGLFFGK